MAPMANAQRLVNLARAPTHGPTGSAPRRHLRKCQYRTCITVVPTVSNRDVIVREEPIVVDVILVDAKAHAIAREPQFTVA